MAYNRPWKSFQEQLELLRDRNLQITDEPAALRYLERIGYYRLSAYLYPFRECEIKQDPDTQQLYNAIGNNFVNNTHFCDSVELYWFDKKLRLLILDALERIEISIRVDIAYLLGERNTFAYSDQSEFHPTFSNRINRRTNKTNFVNWQDKYTGLLDRSKEDFVEHYRKNHGTNLPMWVAIEVWDFGAMSQLFSMMKAPDQELIARKYGVMDFRVFGSWLRSLNYLRNLAAHHSRIWNRNIIDQPKLPRDGSIDWCNEFLGKNDLIAKPFLLLSITNHILKVISPNTNWGGRFITLSDEFPVVRSDTKVTLNDIGLVSNWKSWW